MNIISSYIIRQVKDTSGDIGDDVTKALKRARDKATPDPLDYIRTRFVKIGTNNTRFGIVNGQLYTGNDYPEGTTHEGEMVNGIARFSNTFGIAYCLLKDTAYDAPTGVASFYEAAYGGELEINIPSGSDQPGIYQLWDEQHEGMGNTLFKVNFMWNVPIFANSRDARSYYQYVMDYWDSGTDEDLRRIKDLIENSGIEP